MNRSLLFCLILTLTPAAQATSLQGSGDGATDREIFGLAEEQALLARQIQRLQQTMDVLAGRLEAEGRTRAVELLREGLAVLEKRGEGTAAMTLDERMNAAHDELSAGQWMQSLNRQQEIINDLEALLEVLLDRQDLDKLEQRMEELAVSKAGLENLRGRQDQLQRETKAAQEEATLDQLGDLMSAIETLTGKQNDALALTETIARESGTLERERIEAGIAELNVREMQLASLLEAWSKAELDSTEGALDQLMKAAARARAAAQEERVATALTAAAQALGEDELLEEVAAQIERELEGSAREVDALNEVRAAIDKARETDRESAKVQLEASANRAAAKAKQLISEATSMAKSAQKELEQGGPKQTTKAIATVLKTEPETARELADALDQVLLKLRQRSEAARFLPQAAAGSQAENERTASDLKDALQRLAKERAGATEAEKLGLEQALDQLAEAKLAMTRSREATDDMQSGTQAAAAARDASSALKRALEALAKAAKASARGPAQAKPQTALASQAAELAKKAPGAAAEAMRKAAQAMEAATESLEQGRLGEAAEAQRSALDTLDEAARKAQAEVQPDEATREALAEKQKRIKDDLLNLATRLQEEDRKKAASSVEAASSEAANATESLSQGAMQSAEQQQRNVQEELDRAKEELTAEEEKYQELRREEILIQLTEELQAMIDAHQVQSGEVKEVDAARAGRESPSRAQKLRLRRAAREETVLAEKAVELTALLKGEGSDVFSSAMDEVRTDLERAAAQLGAPGSGALGAGFDSGWRTQSVMRDAERLLTWLLKALNHEAQRRRNEPPPPGGSSDSQAGKNRLVPSQAELRLLRSMELDVQRSIEQTIGAWPELENIDPADIDDLILEDLMRLADRHNRVTKLFRSVARKLEIPGIGEDL